MTLTSTPWTLHTDRDGTDDYLIICNAKGHDLIRSEFFWLPEDDDPIPATLAAVWLMFLAPKLLKALTTLAEQADQDCPAAARSCSFIDAMEQARLAIAQATGRPPYLNRRLPGIGQ